MYRLCRRVRFYRDALHRGSVAWIDLIYIRGHERNLYAFIPFALLPLIRTEGVLFSFLVFCQQYLPLLFAKF